MMELHSASDTAERCSDIAYNQKVLRTLNEVTDNQDVSPVSASDKNVDEQVPTTSKEYFHIVTKRTSGVSNQNLCSDVQMSNNSVPLNGFHITKKGKKRGRKPNVRRTEVFEVPSGKQGKSSGNLNASNTKKLYLPSVVPSLMVNERQKRKTSSRFSTFLKVLKGEKEFYIENEGEDDEMPKKRGRGRKRKEDQFSNTFDTDDLSSQHVLSDGLVSLLNESIDDTLDRTCIIHVKEVSENGQDDALHASVEDGNTLKNVVQEILNLPSSETADIISGIEQLGEQHEVLMDVMNEISSPLKQEISGFHDFLSYKNEILKKEEPLDLLIEEHIFGISGDNAEKQFQINDADGSELNFTQKNLDECISSPYIRDSLATSDHCKITHKVSETCEEEPRLVDSSMPDSVNLDPTSKSVEAKNFRCKLCSQIFSSFSHARQHAKTSHSSTVYDGRLNKKTLSIYFKCPLCNRDFTTEKGRNKHHLLMHLKHNPVQCTECLCKFNSFRPLERHLKGVHDRNPTKFCVNCDEEFVLGSSLEHHITVSHPTTQKTNSPRFTKAPNQEGSKKLLQCPICHKTLSGTKALKLHHNKEHNGEAYNCQQCAYKTTSAAALKRHLAKIHKAVDVLLYVCVDCKAGYQSPQDLEEHYILAHKRSPTNHCPHCGDKFACLEMLRFHKGKHRAFSCDFCPLGFMKEGSLEEHLNKVHKNDLSKEVENLFEVRSSSSMGKDNENDNDKDNTSPIPQKKDCSPFLEKKENNSKVLEIKTDGSVEVKEREDLSFSDTDIDEPLSSTANSYSKIHHLQKTKEGNLQEMDLNNPLKGFCIKDLPKKINCPICGKFLTTKFLRTHILSHNGSLPHKCPKCSKAYAQGTLLRKHMKNRHYEDFLKLGNKNPKKKKTQCEYCQSIFDGIYPLEEHLWQHMDEKNYKCEACGIKFGMKSNWMEHYRSHYFKDEKLCPMCARSFKSIGYYREHIDRCKSNWKCEECGVECENPDLYRKHKKIEHTAGAVLYLCHLCQKSFYSKYQYDDHMITHSSEKKFTCHLCKKIFKRQRPLNEHIARCHSKTSHVCNYCSFSFDSSADLKIHTKEHRQELICSECGVIYLSRQTLDNHIAVHHNLLMQDPYICCCCSEVFEKQNDLKNHMPTHSPETPFVCQVNRCHKMFRKEALLRSHMARSHSYLGYFCHFCDRKFLLDSDLQKHVATHKEHLVFKCNKCDFVCTTKSQLELHNSKHCEEHVYECNLCGIQGTQKTNMSRHLQTAHGMENPSNYISVNKWRCSVCEKVFLSRNSLMTHLEQHSLHGIQAEGNLIKCQLSQPSFHAPDNSTSLNEINISWEDLSNLLKVQVITQTEHSETGEQVKLAANTWQCPVCFYLTNSEEDMKNHLMSSAHSQETLVKTIAAKFREEVSDYKMFPNDSNIHNVSGMVAENSNMQYIIVDNNLVPITSEDSKETSFLLMDNNLPIIVKDETELSHLLNDDATTNLSMIEIPCAKSGSNLKNEVKESIPVEVSQDLLDGTGVLIEMTDGQLIIPDITSEVTQYQLIKEETDEQGTTESTYQLLHHNKNTNQHQPLIVSQDL